MDKKEILKEHQEFIEEINKPENDRIMEVNNLIGLYGEPRFVVGQQFHMQRDDGESVNFNLEKINGKLITIKSFTKNLDKMFNTGDYLELVSSNNNVVKFKIKNINNNIIIMKAETYCKVNFPKEEHNINRSEKRRQKRSQEKLKKLSIKGI